VSLDKFPAAFAEHDTVTWQYGEWSRCEPKRFGFNEGEKTREVWCGPPDGMDAGNFDGLTDYGACITNHDNMDMTGAIGPDEAPLVETWPTGAMPATHYACLVSGSSLRWTGIYDIENDIGCDTGKSCCFQNQYKVQQKNSDQKNSIVMSALQGEGPESKCQPFAGDSVDFGTGETIRFTLDGNSDSASNEGNFIIYGVRYAAKKSGAFMEFDGVDECVRDSPDAECGTSLGRCVDGECVPSQISAALFFTFLGIEAAVIVGLMVLWSIKNSVSGDKAKNNALKNLQKSNAGMNDLNDLLAKKMEREKLKAAEAKAAKKRGHGIKRLASNDDMSLLEGEDFDAFEGVDLCGMQKLNKIDPRDPADRRILQAFQKADSDNSGFIDCDELLRAMIETTGKPWTATQIQKIMDEFDDSGDGELGVEEFKLFVNSTAGGSLNTNRNKYTIDDYNAEWVAPSMAEAIAYSKKDLPKCPPGMGEEIWAREPWIFRKIWSDPDFEVRPRTHTEILPSLHLTRTNPNFSATNCSSAPSSRPTLTTATTE
jgi:hypothetical protein